MTLARLHNVVASVILFSGAGATSVHNGIAIGGPNPIRRVITMLEGIKKNVEEEGKKDKESFKKVVKYCRSGATQALADAQAKIEMLQSSIKETAAAKAQLDNDMGDNNDDLANANSALAEAIALREKQSAAFAKEASEYKQNIAALTKAIAAIKMGMGKFLQTSSARVVQQLSVEMDLSNTDRDVLTSFFTQKSGEGYVPASDQIFSTLGQMKSDMEKHLAEVTKSEEESQSDHSSVVGPKKKEVAALQRKLREKRARHGELSVNLATYQEQLQDAQEEVVENKKINANLEATCAQRKKDYKKLKISRKEELAAIAETITILNDDAALGLFKKTLRSPSLYQLKVTSKQQRRSALEALHSVRRLKDVRLDLLAIALHGQKVSFDKVMSMIDELIALLKKEEKEESQKKDYCLSKLDSEESKLQAAEMEISDIDKAIAEQRDSSGTAEEDIADMAKNVKDLDNSVVEMTAARKKESQQFLDNMAQRRAAKDLLLFAKNRLNKFYNPSMYKEQQKPEVPVLLELKSSDVSAFAGKPPKGLGPYKKKASETRGVTEMFDALVNDLDLEVKAMEVEEKDAQSEYETFMTDAQDKRVQLVKAIEKREENRATLGTDIEKSMEEAKSKMFEASTTKKVIAQLHADCDWLVQNYEARKEGRTSEIESLKKAKMVLSGADFSLVQAARRHSHVHNF